MRKAERKRIPVRVRNFMYMLGCGVWSGKESSRDRRPVAVSISGLLPGRSAFPRNVQLFTMTPIQTLSVKGTLDQKAFIMVSKPVRK